MPSPPPLTPNAFLSSLLDLDFKIPETKAVSNAKNDQLPTANPKSESKPPAIKTQSMNHTRTYSNLSTISSMTPTIPIFTEPPITPNSFMRELEDIEYQATFSQHSRSQSWSGANHKVQVPRPISAPMYNQDAVFMLEPIGLSPMINQPFEAIEDHYTQELAESESTRPQRNFEAAMSLENKNVRPEENQKRNATRKWKIETNLSKTESTEFLSGGFSKILSIESLDTSSKQNISIQETREVSKKRIRKASGFSSESARQAYLVKQREADRQRRVKWNERKVSLENRLKDMKRVNERLKLQLLELNSRIQSLGG